MKTHLIMARIYAVLYLLCAIGPYLAIAFAEPTNGNHERAMAIAFWYSALIVPGYIGYSAALAGNMRLERQAMLGIVIALLSYAGAVQTWGAGLDPATATQDTFILLCGVALFGPIRLAWHLHRPLERVKFRIRNPAMRGDDG
jgi:hypothetical protein